jgi:hypothetical protein
MLAGQRTCHNDETGATFGLNSKVLCTEAEDALTCYARVRMIKSSITKGTYGIANRLEEKETKETSDSTIPWKLGNQKAEQ